MSNHNPCNGTDNNNTTSGKNTPKLKAQNKDTDAASRILAQWDEAWKKGKNPENQQASAPNPYDDLFYDLVHKSYWEFYKKAIKNRRKNFLSKFLLLFIALLFSLAGISLILYSLGFWGESGLETVNYFLSESFLAIFSAMILNTISKWISIKKYQETWSRHSRGLHNMQNEMLRYVCHLEPYQEPLEGFNDFKSMFIERMLKIWGENQNLFQSNLETKEEAMEDYLKYTKPSK